MPLLRVDDDDYRMLGRGGADCFRDGAGVVWRDASNAGDGVGVSGVRCPSSG